MLQQVGIDGDLLCAYWEHYRLSRSSERADRLRAVELFWAWEAVEELVEAQLPDVVAALVELAEAASGDEAALAYLGAGPLEELLLLDVERHVDAVDDAARTSAAFRTALRCAWFDAEIDPAVAERLRRFGPPL